MLQRSRARARVGGAGWGSIHPPPASPVSTRVCVARSLASSALYRCLATDDGRCTLCAQVRFDSSRRRSSRILFLTEGLLLRQIASDPDLSSYSVVIIDEVNYGRQARMHVRCPIFHEMETPLNLVRMRWMWVACCRVCGAHGEGHRTMSVRGHSVCFCRIRMSVVGPEVRDANALPSMRCSALFRP